MLSDVGTNSAHNRTDLRADVDADEPDADCGSEHEGTHRSAQRRTDGCSDAATVRAGAAARRE